MASKLIKRKMDLDLDADEVESEERKRREGRGVLGRVVGNTVKGVGIRLLAVAGVVGAGHLIADNGHQDLSDRMGPTTMVDVKFYTSDVVRMPVGLRIEDLVNSGFVSPASDVSDPSKLIWTKKAKDHGITNYVSFIDNGPVVAQVTAESMQLAMDVSKAPKGDKVVQIDGVDIDQERAQILITAFGASTMKKVFSSNSLKPIEDRIPVLNAMYPNADLKTGKEAALFSISQIENFKVEIEGVELREDDVNALYNQFGGQALVDIFQKGSFDVIGMKDGLNPRDRALEALNRNGDPSNEI